MSAPRVRAAGDTHPGLQRDQNEDRFFFDDKAGVYCVIDGVGGHAAGEKAAQIAADVLRRALAGGAPDAGRLRAAFARASDAIHEEAARDPALRGMACVATLALLTDARVRFAHVGDTRLYKIRDGSIVKLSHDQSPVGELEDAGALTETEAMRHPRRNEIYRDLGSQPGREVADGVEVGEVPFEPDAALLICSDGLSDQVSAASIRRIVESFAGSPALAVQELLTAANDAGGKDNVTVVLVEGERFASSVKARPARPAGTVAGSTAAAPGRAAAPVGAQPPSAVSSPGDRGIARAVGWFVAGLLVGATAMGAAWWYGVDLPRLLGRNGVAPPAIAGPQTWEVGLDPSADFATIGEALERAQPGDTITVGPGEYREQVVLREGVRLIGTRASVLRPPLGAGADWVAVTGRQIGSGLLQGFVIAAAANQPMGVGLVVEQATFEVDDVEITGAAVAAVELRAGARITLRGSHLHDNPGVGAIVRAGAEPRLERNVIMHNGLGATPLRPGVLVEPGARPVLVSNGVGGNGGAAVEGWPAAGLTELARRNVLSPPPAAPTPARPPRRR